MELWFVLIAVLWMGYFILEGFDYGVGILLPMISRDDTDRRVILGTIGPVWDGNEVWLITAVGAMFAAFPAWYADLLSGFYLPIVAILVGLIIRGVSLEFRGKATTPEGRAWCDRGIFFGSLIPAFMWGAVFGTLLYGALPGSVGLEVLSLPALFGGLLSLALFTLHGAAFLTLKTGLSVRARSRKAALACAFATVPLSALLVPAAPGWTKITAALAVALLTVAVAFTLRARDGSAFLSTALAIVVMSVTLFGALWPSPLPGLTVYEAASSPYTLRLMTWAGIILLPLILAYQGWTYWVFRKRLTRKTV
ncbi:cytochrome d ubiquinol oxidase subunit II [Rhizohabitans arisaemae]|uniref:cytochrome d ubiquinol oxidase subunit II n=1 Tax=Rhizohabitans arisaemae TaxID=2720610 RepID=UPI0024B18595|nr:cytochrome d ubiquinol oxidase subunit II [Rhizohabitans arisaemae]